jgi:hypothetical protein
MESLQINWVALHCAHPKPGPLNWNQLCDRARGAIIIITIIFDRESAAEIENLCDRVEPLTKHTESSFYMQPLFASSEMAKMKNAPWGPSQRNLASRTLSCQGAFLLQFFNLRRDEIVCYYNVSTPKGMEPRVARPQHAKRRLLASPIYSIYSWWCSIFLNNQNLWRRARQHLRVWSKNYCRLHRPANANALGWLRGSVFWIEFIKNWGVQLIFHGLWSEFTTSSLQPQWRHYGAEATEFWHRGLFLLHLYMWLRINS